MVMFDHNTMRPWQRRKASLLSTLMTETRAKTAALFRFLYDDKNDDLQIEDEQDDDDDGNNFFLFDDVLEVEEAATPALPDFIMVQAPALSPRPKPRKKRTKFSRRNQRESVWWTRFLAPAKRDELLLTPIGRLSAQFRKLFYTPYDVFLDLMNLATERWWQEWTEGSRCRAGKLVSCLHLKVLGALFVLAQGVTHLVCSACSNLSEEVHRSFFQEWMCRMSSIKDEFIFMPHDDYTFQRVTEEHGARGLPGCIGSVDCVHIGWDRCPTQYKNMYSGKEAYPSVAYEVICTCRKFIQSVSCGHPGTRNDKHIGKTDQSVMQLLENNGWLNSKAWHTGGPDGR